MLFKYLPRGAMGGVAARQLGVPSGWPRYCMGRAQPQPRAAALEALVACSNEGVLQRADDHYVGGGAPL